MNNSEEYNEILSVKGVEEEEPASDASEDPAANEDSEEISQDVNDQVSDIIDQRTQSEQEALDNAIRELAGEISNLEDVQIELQIELDQLSTTPAPTDGVEVTRGDAETERQASEFEADTRDALSQTTTPKQRLAFRFKFWSWIIGLVGLSLSPFVTAVLVKYLLDSSGKSSSQDDADDIPGTDQLSKEEIQKIKEAVNNLVQDPSDEDFWNRVAKYTVLNSPSWPALIFLLNDVIRVSPEPSPRFEISQEEKVNLTFDLIHVWAGQPAGQRYSSIIFTTLATLKTSDKRALPRVFAASIAQQACASILYTTRPSLEDRRLLLATSSTPRYRSNHDFYVNFVLDPYRMELTDERRHFHFNSKEEHLEVLEHCIRRVNEGRLLSNNDNKDSIVDYRFHRRSRTAPKEYFLDYEPEGVLYSRITFPSKDKKYLEDYARFLRKKNFEENQRMSAGIGPSVERADLKEENVTLDYLLLDAEFPNSSEEGLHLAAKRGVFDDDVLKCEKHYALLKQQMKNLSDGARETYPLMDDEILEDEIVYPIDKVEKFLPIVMPVFFRTQVPNRDAKRLVTKEVLNTRIGMARYVRKTNKGTLMITYPHLALNKRGKLINEFDPIHRHRENGLYLGQSSRIVFYKNYSSIPQLQISTLQPPLNGEKVPYIEAIEGGPGGITLRQYLDRLNNLSVQGGSDYFPVDHNHPETVAFGHKGCEENIKKWDGGFTRGGVPPSTANNSSQIIGNVISIIGMASFGVGGPTGIVVGTGLSILGSLWTKFFPNKSNEGKALIQGLTNIVSQLITTAQIQAAAGPIHSVGNYFNSQAKRYYKQPHNVDIEEDIQHFKTYLESIHDPNGNFRSAIASLQVPPIKVNRSSHVVDDRKAVYHSSREIGLALASLPVWIYGASLHLNVIKMLILLDSIPKKKLASPYIDDLIDNANLYYEHGSSLRSRVFELAGYRIIEDNGASEIANTPFIYPPKLNDNSEGVNGHRSIEVLDLFNHYGFFVPARHQKCCKSNGKADWDTARPAYKNYQNCLYTSTLRNFNYNPSSKVDSAVSSLKKTHDLYSKYRK